MAIGQTKEKVEKEYYENGKLKYIGNSIDEIETGEWKYYYENGKLKSEGKYIEGNEAGEWKFYDETGKLAETIKFFDGKLSDNIPPIQKYLDDIKMLEIYDNPTKVTQKISVTTFILTSNTKDVENFKEVYSDIDWSDFEKFKYKVYDDFVVIEFFFYDSIPYEYTDNNTGEKKNKKVYSFRCSIWPKDETEVLEILKDWKDKRDGNF